MNIKNELPYLVYTIRDYAVTGPDTNGEIEIEARDNKGFFCIYLTADDLRMMLDRIERGKK